MDRMGLIILVVLLAVAFPGFDLVSATHFRYGTLKWEPTSVVGSQNCVEFEMKAAFRRDYEWGRWFKEEYSSDATNWMNGGSYYGMPKNESAYQKFNGDPSSYMYKYYLRFKVGMGTIGQNLAPSSGPDSPENQGGMLCPTPNNKGFNATDPLFPTGALRPPGKALDPALMVCTPWAEAFGFFFGDGTFLNDGLILRIESVDKTKSMLGNVIRGTSLPFTKCYSSPTNAGAPYVAFFTGGNRLSYLNNNANGRYRLEIDVLLDGSNRSPIATQIPVLPVPYTDTPHARFQIAGFDPDVSDSVNFFLGTPNQFGGIMAHQVVLPTGTASSTWYKDVYVATVCGDLCTDGSNPCTKFWRASWCSNFNSANAIDNKAPAFTADNTNPGPPPDLTIEMVSGFVTWRTGIDPFTSSSPDTTEGGRSYSPKQPGFYNLVVMVKDVVHDIKVPIDFLLYLYPPMRYCSVGCNSSRSGANLATLNSADGLYGDPSGSTPGEALVYNGPGTGYCSICGGGGIYNDAGTIITYSPQGLSNSTFCSVKNLTTGNPLGTGNAALDYTCTTGNCIAAANRTVAVEVGRGTCMGTREPKVAGGTSIVPYTGTLSVCRLNTAPYFLTPNTPRKGPTPPMGTTRTELGTYPPASVIQKVKTVVNFTLMATDDDECVELEIGETGLYAGMVLQDHVRVDTRTVQRTFLWPVMLDANGADDRERDITVCFYAFDMYLITANPFHCVRIQLIEPSNVVWCDEGIRGVGTYGADGATYDAFLGEEACIPLCVRRDSETPMFAELSVRALHSGTDLLPTTTRPFPHDNTNYPPSGMIDETKVGNPVAVDYCFVPTVKEECSYTVCFQGYDRDPGRPDVSSVRCYIIQVKNDVLEFPLPQMPNLGYALSANNLSSTLVPNQGLTFSAWVYPSCALQNVNETILSFGSDRNFGSDSDPGGRDNGLRVRNALKWNYGPSGGQFFYFDCFIGEVYSPPYYGCNLWHYVTVSISPDNSALLVVDGTRRGHRLNNRRELFKFSVTPFSTPSRPDNGLDGDANGTFVLGYREGEPFVGALDEVRVWSRNLSLAEIQEKQMARFLDPLTEEALAGYYTMRPGLPAIPWYKVLGSLWSQDAPLAEPLAADYAGSSDLTVVGAPLNMTVGAPLITTSPIPPMIPCVLGLEHMVGPCDGDCLLSVYGWSIAQGTMLKCKFGDVEVIGNWMSDSEAKCNTPGHFSPRYVTVTLSNDGVNFTDPFWAGKTVEHLYLESSLYIDGTAGAGAQADSVCEGLPTNTVTFGGWFCPRCGPATTKPPPPPPKSPPPSPPPRSPPPSPPPKSPPPHPPPMTMMGGPPSEESKPRGKTTTKSKTTSKKG